MTMIHRGIIVGSTLLAVGLSAAHAGPCNMKSSEMRDAGSGPTTGAAKQTTGTGTGGQAKSGDHPPTSAMNKEAAQGPASSEDAQRQMQGRPTAAQQAEGAKADDC